MTNLLLPILTVVAERAKENFVQKTRRTFAVQEQFLRGVLQAYRDTEVDQKYGFRDITVGKILHS